MAESALPDQSEEKTNEFVSIFSGEESEGMFLSPEEESKSIEEPNESKPIADSNVQPMPIISMPEPIDSTEARQQYDESVEQAMKPYREELEKELAIAKKNGVLNLVLALEEELKHLASDECTKITSFKPEKRTLFNAKVRFKKKIETALEDGIVD